MHGPSRKVLRGKGDFCSARKMDVIAVIPMVIISLLTSLVPLNGIERTLILAGELKKVPPLCICNTSHYTDPTHFLVWCLCSKQTAQPHEVALTATVDYEAGKEGMF